MYTLLFVCSIGLVALARGDDNLSVETRSGIVNGTSSVETNGTFKIYYGVPFAEPPVGTLRFQAPVPVKPWSGVRDATKPPSVCVQPKEFGVINGPTIGQEDCLYLNIYVPNNSAKTPVAKKLPVIVYVHGGALQSGSGIQHKPDYFMKYNVVFVTLNYRLGVLGFLGMNNDVISGNFGMKDQALALKWIKENIAAFGGDPNNVSLMGESAGAVSVHAHMFSPLSKGLFHKAIMQSGGTFGALAYFDAVHAEALATSFLFTVGCVDRDHHRVLKCLQRVSAEDLIKTESKLYVWENDPTMLFKLIVESKVKNQPFLPAEPSKKSYVTKDIPVIIGMNSGEGIFKLYKYLANGGSLAKIINSDRKRLLPVLNQYLYTTDFELVDNVTQKISDYYFANKDIGSDTVSQIAQMFTDSYFTHAVVSVVLTYSAPRYVYYFDHQRGSYSQAELTGFKRDLGVCHADELPLLFRDEQLEAKWTPEDKRVSAELLQYWTDFAVYSDPNGNSTRKVWTPVKTNGVEYLHIKSDSSAMEKNFLKERYDFWQSLPIRRKFVV